MFDVYRLLVCGVREFEIMLLFLMSECLIFCCSHFRVSLKE